MFTQTINLPWDSLRDDVSANDTPLSAPSYSDWPSSGTFDLAGATFKDANGLLIAAFGTAAANKDMLYKLYGRSRMCGPVALLLTGIMTLGTQNCTVHPIDGTTVTDGEWVDTITNTGGLFTGEASILNSGNNQQAMIKLDRMCFKDLFLEVDLDGGSDAMTKFYAIICGH